MSIRYKALFFPFINELFPFVNFFQHYTYIGRKDV